MKKTLRISLPWILTACCLGAVAAMAGSLYARPVFRPVLRIVGDIANVIEVDDISSLTQPEVARIGNKRYRAVPLADVVALAEPYAEIRRIVFIADDGFSAEISGDAIEGSFLTYSARSGWQVLNPAHPISANATRLTQIVLAVNKDETDHSLQIIADGNVYSITPGELLAGPRLDYPYYEGMAEKELDGIRYTSTVYTRRSAASEQQLMLPPHAHLLLFTAGGQNMFVLSGQGIWQISGNRIDYLQPDTRLCLEDIRLIYVDPPDDYLAGLGEYADKILLNPGDQYA